MSYLQRIQTCNNTDFSALLPFVIEGARYGWVQPDFAARLQAFPAVFLVTEQQVCLHPELTAYQQRIEAVRQAMYALHQEGVIDTWVNESYPITRGFAQPVVMEVERAAASFLGVKSFGVHVNGLVQTEQGVRVWVGQRTLSKPFWPGKLDQMVAGGQPTGMGLLDNVIKEAGEEANVPAAIAAQAEQVAALDYQHQTRRGLEDSTLFVYDLWLPEDFVPVNNDGEVAGFRLLSLQALAELTETSEAFKDNCNLVNIDLLLRHGVLTDDHADYHQIKAMLYQTTDNV